MVIYGLPGLGKSYTIQELARVTQGIYYYCAPGHSPRSLCNGILEACQQSATGSSTSEQIQTVASHLSANKAPLYLDDCDNLTHKGTLLETVRAIHDLSGQPVVMTGMNGFVRKISRHPQLLDRAHILEFTPITLEDVTSLALTLSEVQFDQGLCEKIHHASQGKTRLAVRAINYCDKWAVQHKYDTIDIKKWGNQPLLPKIDS